MVSSAGNSRLGPAYLWTVIVIGLAIVAWSVFEWSANPIPWQWFLLAGLTLISGSATVRLPSSSHASISVSEVFVFIAILLYGRAAGTVIVALDGLIISFWLAKRHRELSRAFFNVAAPALSAWCAAEVFFVTSGIAPLTTQPATLNQILLPLGLSALVYFGTNTWLVTFAIFFERKVKPLEVWLANFAWLSLNYFAGASVAVLVVVYNRTLDLAFIFVIVPLLFVLYFVFKTTMGRVEDANRHVEQVNALYLSTIETLAMAIDAKDQITHGHIRRVQTFAVGLAQHLGISDVESIKAIEAAALLHDTGKLAVPEYILNKPGKLTPAEFEKMKLHVTVGADILSAIDFPYPVVPIVRTHHENWDGTGYPRGVKGTDIPIGARILSVVDCFDALTSDRPYRPRLADEDAMEILRQRRGSMYDPLVVDTFIRVHAEIAPKAEPWAATHHALNEIASATHTQAAEAGASGLDDISASSDEMLTLYELARALSGQASVDDKAGIVGNHLRRLIPFSLCVFYMYEPATDELEAKHAVGEAAPLVKGMKIQLGQRLSGWVAANWQTILNSDAALDLGDTARSANPRLRNCLSTPMRSGDQLIGVLTLYSSASEGFTEDHRRLIEVVARQTAHALKRGDRDAQRQAFGADDPVERRNLH